MKDRLVDGVMTAEEFRKMALSLPEVAESAHMEHPDFRVGERIFASLGYPDGGWGMVILPPEEQMRVCGAEPEVFVPVKGAWGRAGNTQVNLKVAKKASVREALSTAYAERVRKNGKKKGGKSYTVSTEKRAQGGRR